MGIGLVLTFLRSKGKSVKLSRTVIMAPTVYRGCRGPGTEYL